MPNNFSPLDDIPNEDDLKKLISNMQYKKIEISDLPKPISDNGLVNKCNSFILAASGSTDGMLYSFVGIRPDKGDVIDEHPFVYYYDYTKPEKNFGGIIHHGDWPDRTTQMDPNQIAALANSGLTASFSYKSIPTDSSGSLPELHKNGMLNGLSKQFEILMAKPNRTKPKKKK